MLECLEPRQLLSAVTAVKAFPEAEGYGAGAIGGRGGRVLFVTNLNDSGPGSLREALEAEGSRTVVFRVAGVITLNRMINVENPYLTIAGQTAPLPGITLRLDESSYTPEDIRQSETLLNIATHDVVVRYLKFRRGDSMVSGDNINLNAPAYNVIIDRCSLSWSTDESATIWTKERVNADEAEGIHNVTFQRTIVGESLNQQRLHWLNPDRSHSPEQIADPNYTDFVGDPLNNVHPLAFVIGGDTDRTAWQKVREIDLHHNLFANNTHRNPEILSRGTRIINNVVWNWFTRAGMSMWSSQVDYIGNVYRHGPLTRTVDGGPSVAPRPHFLWHAATDALLNRVDPDDGSLFLQYNIAPEIPEMSSPDNDNWAMLMEAYTGDSRGPSPQLDLALRRSEPLPEALHPVTVSVPTTFTMFDFLDDIGATQFLDAQGNFRSHVDFVDARNISGARTNRTSITTKSRIYQTAQQAGGYAAFATQLEPAYVDADLDGMSDIWEDGYGIDFDANQDLDLDGYTNLEEFLNGTNPFNSELTKVDNFPRILERNGTRGLEIETLVTASATRTMSAQSSILVSGEGQFDLWLDVNRDGDWDDLGEQLIANQHVVAGENAIRFEVPTGTLIGPAQVLLRVSRLDAGLGSASFEIVETVDIVPAPILVGIDSRGRLSLTDMGGFSNSLVVSFDVVTADVVVTSAENDLSTDGTTRGKTARFRKRDLNGTMIANLDAGDDTLVWALSELAGTVHGGAGRDTLVGGMRTDKLFGDGDSDLLIGGSAADTLDGGSGDDRLLGSGGDGDVLTGGLGNDSLDGGSGKDQLVETADSSFWLSNHQLIGLGSDVLQRIELASLTGGVSDNVIDAGLFSGSVTLHGTDGRDSLVGGTGSDQLWGGRGDDTLLGMNGRDYLSGGEGADLAVGGDDDDFISGDEGDDSLAGSAGNDLVIGSFGNDILWGGAGNDTLLGAANSDLVLGGFGDDYIDGQGSNSDTVAGGEGNDTVRGATSEIDETFVLAPALLARLLFGESVPSDV